MAARKRAGRAHGPAAAEPPRSGSPAGAGTGSPDGRGSAGPRVGLLAALVALAAFAAFAPARHNGFVDFDDPGYVFENPHVRAGLTGEGALWALTTGAQSNWHPLTWLSHMLDVELFGVEGELSGIPAPGWHHLSSALLHALAAAALLLWLAQATGAPWSSLAVAALFALHPLRVESVAWASERKDVLSTLLGFASLWAWVRWTRLGGARRYLQALALFALGLAAKPMLVTLPCLMLLLDGWPLERRRGEPLLARGVALAREKLPFFALAAASAAATLFVQRRAMHLTEVVPLGFRLQNALVAYAAYLRKAVWPSDLAVLYPYAGEITAGALAAAALVLAALTALAVAGARRRPWLLVGWLWYLGTLVPVIGVVQVGLQSMADRYTYLPLVGVTVALVWSARELVLARPALRPAAAGAGVLVAALLALATVRTVALWRDTETLFEHAIAVTGRNGWAWRILGGAYARAGRTAEAVRAYQSALEVWPEDPEAWAGLGYCASREGRYGEAAQRYREAARLAPDDAAHRANLASALAKGGDLAGAEEELRAALALDPALVRAHNDLGKVLAVTGRTAEALASFRAAERLEPDNAAVVGNLAALYATSGDARLFDPQEAVRLAERALALSGARAPQLLDALAAAYAAAGRPREAVATAEEAQSRAESAGLHELAAGIGARLASYRRGL